ncbi:hypothetical protein THTE_3016 [Thermogutta terrifontis]|uniref:Uncharacterized protein n=1 Tax=Thermogutta terrifontis TaxID=1331910 RepID=A0A286RI38_9BACT|nr:hypothetical protein THTE_3016 [Thermogutta terrifontis]
MNLGMVWKVYFPQGEIAVCRGEPSRRARGNLVAHPSLTTLL